MHAIIIAQTDHFVTKENVRSPQQLIKAINSSWPISKNTTKKIYTPLNEGIARRGSLKKRPK